MNKSKYHSIEKGCEVVPNKTQLESGTLKGRHLRHNMNTLKCLTHNVTTCHCGWEFGWHYGTNSLLMRWRYGTNNKKTNSKNDTCGVRKAV